MTVLTVSQINGYLKSLLDGDPNLNPVFISGEISEFYRPLPFRSPVFFFERREIGSESRDVCFQCPPAAIPSVRRYESTVPGQNQFI